MYCLSIGVYNTVLIFLSIQSNYVKYLREMQAEILLPSHRTHLCPDLQASLNSNLYSQHIPLTIVLNRKWTTISFSLKWAAMFVKKKILMNSFVRYLKKALGLRKWKEKTPRYCALVCILLLDISTEILEHWGYKNI